MTTQNTAMVAEERVVDLVAALNDVTTSPTDDGMATIEGPVGPPAVRALMRVEAELLVADANAQAAGAIFGRTYDQRRADAFKLLLERMAASRPPNVNRHWK